MAFFEEANQAIDQFQYGANQGAALGGRVVGTVSSIITAFDNNYLRANGTTTAVPVEPVPVNPPQFHDMQITYDAAGNTRQRDLLMFAAIITGAFVVLQLAK